MEEQQQDSINGSMDEAQRECIQCGEVPDSIICLSCSHCLCLHCSARILFSVDEPNLEVLECPSCGESTLLSQDIQAAFIELLQAGEINLEDMIEEEEEGYDGEEGEEEELSNRGSRDENELGDGSVDKDIGEVDECEERDDGEEEEYGEEEEQIEGGDGEEEEGYYAEGEEEIGENREGSHSSAISLHFICMNHPNEEYSYYSSNSRKLLCAECLLELAQNGIENDARSLRKCLPLIIQHFEDFLNNVEVNKSLTENRIQEVGIKGEEARAKVDSIRNKISLKFDEIFDSLNDLKDDIVGKFDVFWQTKLENLTESSIALEEKLGHFDQILEQIAEIQKVSESVNEDLLGFYFSNQDELTNAINDKAINFDCTDIVRRCHRIADSIDKGLDSSFEGLNKSLFKNIKVYFDDLLNETSTHKTQNSAQALLDRLAERKTSSFEKGDSGIEFFEKRKASDQKTESHVHYRSSQNTEENVSDAEHNEYDHYATRQRMALSGGKYFKPSNEKRFGYRDDKFDIISSERHQSTHNSFYKRISELQNHNLNPPAPLRYKPFELPLKYRLIGATAGTSNHRAIQKVPISAGRIERLLGPTLKYKPLPGGTNTSLNRVGSLKSMYSKTGNLNLTDLQAFRQNLRQKIGNIPINSFMKSSNYRARRFD